MKEILIPLIWAGIAVWLLIMLLRAILPSGPFKIGEGEVIDKENSKITVRSGNREFVIEKENCDEEIKVGDKVTIYF